MAAIICDTLLEAARVQLAIHKLSDRIDGRGYPYMTPGSPGDVRGFDAGTTVEVRRHVRPVRLVDGKIAVPVSALVQRLLTSGRLGEITELTAAQRTRILALWAARRELLANEEADDQSGLED